MPQFTRSESAPASALDWQISHTFQVSLHSSCCCVATSSLLNGSRGSSCRTAFHAAMQSVHLSGLGGRRRTSNSLAMLQSESGQVSLSMTPNRVGAHTKFVAAPAQDSESAATKTTNLNWQMEEIIKWPRGFDRFGRVSLSEIEILKLRRSRPEPMLSSQKSDHSNWSTVDCLSLESHESREAGK